MTQKARVERWERCQTWYTSAGAKSSIVSLLSTAMAKQAPLAPNVHSLRRGVKASAKAPSSHGMARLSR